MPLCHALQSTVPIPYPSLAGTGGEEILLTPTVMLEQAVLLARLHRAARLPKVLISTPVTSCAELHPTVAGPLRLGNGLTEFPIKSCGHLFPAICCLLRIILMQFMFFVKN